MLLIYKIKKIKKKKKFKENKHTLEVVSRIKYIAVADAD